MIRKFRRNSLRKRVGSKNLQSTWKRFQINKYGKDYYDICIKPNRSRRVA